MCARILAFCRRLGFTARIAVAGTPGAAHALARFGGEPLMLCPAGGEADALAPMPLAALRLDEDAARRRARRLGLERIGELIAMPRAPLAAPLRRDLAAPARSGAGPRRRAVRSDRARRRRLPILLRFLEPIASAEAIAEASGEAVRRLVPLLDRGRARRPPPRPAVRAGRRRACRSCASASPARPATAPICARLLCAKIETIEPGFGIERLRLVAARVEPLGAAADRRRAGRRRAGARSRRSGRPPRRPARRAPALSRSARSRATCPNAASRARRRRCADAGEPGRALAAAVRLLAPPEPIERSWRCCPTTRRRASPGAAGADRVAAPTAPSASSANGGSATPSWPRSATISRSRTRPASASGSSAPATARMPATGDLSWFLHGIFG